MIKQAYINYTWDNLLHSKDFQEEYKLIKDEYNKFADIVPIREDLDNWYKRVPLSDIKVVIIGQDPYPSFSLASGVSFATKSNLLSSSLSSIFKKLKVDNTSTLEPNLLHWSKQGVLLVNAQPITRTGKPNFYHKRFNFISLLISFLNKIHHNLVYLLWGKSASLLLPKISPENYVIVSSHPSPLGANKSLGTYPSFNSCDCFNECNNYLKRHKIKEIGWI